MSQRRSQRERSVALIVTPRYLPLLGGMERECALLAAEFERRGWQPLVITELLDMPLPTAGHFRGIRVLRIPSKPTRSLFVQLKVASILAFLVLRHRRQVSFAIVRTATLPALVVGALKALGLVSFPTLVTAETGGADDDVAALEQRPLFPLSRALVAANDCLNGLCQANIENLYKYGFPRSKITMIPNGIDTRPWETTRAPARVEHFLFLGRIEASKGVFELVEAFRDVHDRHRQLTLTVAGEGPAREELAVRSVALGLESAVRFIGRVPYERLGTVFEVTDCLVLPSYSEGMPLSVLEAASHRRVLIVTDVGDIKRLFGNRIHICRPRDIRSLASAMEAAVLDVGPVTDYGDVIESVAIETVAEAMLERLRVRSLSIRT